MAEDKIVRESEWKDKVALKTLLHNNILRISSFGNKMITEPHSGEIRYMLKHCAEFPTTEATTKISS